MKRAIPTFVAVVVGLVVLLDFFLDIRYLNVLGTTFTNWAILLVTFALIIGVFNLLQVHFARLRRRESGWGYSIVLIIALWVVLVLGILDPAGPEGIPVAWIFDHIQFPLQAAIFSLLAFFILTAAYRAFRVRRWDSIFFVVAGLIVLIGATPLGQILWQGFGEAREWILTVPAMAGARGIVIGVALATVMTGLRLLMGIDRPYAE